MKKAKMVFLILSLVFYVISIGLIFYWFDYKLFLVIFLFVTAYGFQNSHGNVDDIIKLKLIEKKLNKLIELIKKDN